MNYKKGFTLIELLVVIAIIGILSSVVLASLNTARDKGADAAAKSNLNGARAQAELFYDAGTTYANVCTSDTGIKKQYLAAVSSTGATDGTTAVCVGTSSDGWGAAIKLKTAGKYYCVDSTGYAGELTTNTNPITTADRTCQ